MAILNLEDIKNTIIPQFVFINRQSLLEDIDEFENGQIIFCNENKNIYLKMNDEISRYNWNSTGVTYVNQYEENEYDTAIINSQTGQVYGRGNKFLSIIEDNDIIRNLFPLYIEYIKRKSSSSIIDNELYEKGNSIITIIENDNIIRNSNPYFIQFIENDNDDSNSKTTIIENNTIEKHSDNLLSIIDENNEVIYGQNSYYVTFI